MTTPVKDFVQANTNGVLHAAADPSLSPLNRGFLYGDAVYEVWRSYHRRIFAWEGHWNRLHASAHSIHLDIPWSEDVMLAAIKSTTEAYRVNSSFDGDLYIRLQIYRGEGAIGLNTELADQPGFVVLVKPVPQLSAATIKAGLSLIVAETIRRNPPQSLDPAWKTGNYLNNIMGLREASARGADDVVFLNLAGEITEASTSNLAFIKGDVFVTPPLASGILAGITRATILQQVARRAGLKVVERTIIPADLAGFDEAMLLSTTKDIQPVGRINGHPYRVGEDATLWRLKTAFEAHASDSLTDHPEYSV